MTIEINMEGFKRRDKKEFEKIYLLYNGVLYYFAHALIRERQKAEDIVIEAFYKLFQRCEYFDTPLNIKAFLFITVKNSCFNFLEWKKRQITHQKEYRDSIREAEEPTVFQNMVETELLQQVRNEIEDLPGTCREVIKLHYFENLTNAQIAEKMGISPSNVSSQLHIARKKLCGLRQKILDSF